MNKEIGNGEGTIDPSKKTEKRKPLAKSEQFVADTLSDKIDPLLKKSLGKYAGDPDLRIIIKFAIQYGGMSEEEILDAIDSGQWPEPEKGEFIE